MLFIQLTGLSGSGKTTLAVNTKKLLEEEHYKLEILDGDDYRKHLCRDLGFSKEDRLENIRRLGFIGLLLASHNIITIMAAVNPYEQMRQELKRPNSRLIWIDCPIEILKTRDTKGLYKRAQLPDDNIDKITNLSGYNDPYETTVNYDLRIETGYENPHTSTLKLLHYIKSELMKSVASNLKLVTNGS